MEMRLKPARTSRLSPCGVTLSGLASSVIVGVGAEVEALLQLVENFFQILRAEEARRAAAEVERLDPVCGGEGYDARTFCRIGLGNRGLVRSGGRGRGCSGGCSRVCSGIRRATGVLRPGTAPLYLPLVPVRRAAPREVPCGARAMCRRKSRSNGSDFCKKGYGCRRLPCFSEWIFGAGRCLYRNCNGLFTVAGPGCRARYPFVFRGPFLRSSQSGASLLQEKNLLLRGSIRAQDPVSHVRDAVTGCPPAGLRLGRFPTGGRFGLESGSKPQPGMAPLPSFKDSELCISHAINSS